MAVLLMRRSDLRPQGALHLLWAGEELSCGRADAPEITARFRDPGGNVLGLYQEPGA